MNLNVETVPKMARLISVTGFTEKLLAFLVSLRHKK